MRTPLPRLLVFKFVCCWMASVLVLSGAEFKPQPGDTLEKDLRSLLGKVVQDGWSKGMVLGWTGPDGDHFLGFGSRSAEDTRPPDAATPMEIGSVTKVFTSILLAREVVSGRAALEDPVNERLPATCQFPSGPGGALTLGDLAAHTSGLPVMPRKFLEAWRFLVQRKGRRKELDRL